MKQKIMKLTACSECNKAIFSYGEEFVTIYYRKKGIHGSKTKTLCKNCYIKGPKPEPVDYIKTLEDKNEEGHSCNSNTGLPEGIVRNS